MSTLRKAAVLVDFGGVITTSVIGAFRAFGTALGDTELPLRLLGSDEVSKALLADHEAGRIDARTFEEGFAGRLRDHGVQVEVDGLIERMQSGLRPDPETIALLIRLRAAGVPIALVSNAFGRDTYRGFDLSELADVSVISSEVGVRKPARRIFEIACERLGVHPTLAVMIDDLQHNLDGAARLGIDGVLHSDGASTARELAARFGFPATEAGATEAGVQV